MINRIDVVDTTKYRVSIVILRNIGVILYHIHVDMYLCTKVQIQLSSQGFMWHSCGICVAAEPSYDLVLYRRIRD